MKKRLICVLLVLCMVAAVMPVTAAAADTVEIQLRSGNTVNVGTAQEFAKAYQAVYEADSTINRIRLVADIRADSNGLRAADGNDPYMSGYEGQLCIRMPEGTCLDLNGCTLTMRAFQGYDASGIVSMGTVVDTYGGGKINFYPINKGQYIGRTIELAELYPEYVRAILISGQPSNVADYEYTIPENVCLRFTAANSALPAKKVTLKPGATVEKVYDTAPGLSDCGAVVLQYVDTVDKARLGSEYATQTVKVSGTIPTYPSVDYKFVDENGEAIPPCFVYKPDALAAEPALIKSASVATTEAAVILNPSGVQFQEPRKLTYAEHQKLIQDIAVTYYYQSNEASHIQYDGREVDDGGKLERHADDGRPEDAGFDSTVFSVCSNYPWKVYRTAYSTGYKLFRMSYARSRTWADFDPDTTPELVYQYSGPLAKNSKGETDFETALVESRKVVQPGDILAHCNELSGHALLFVGDIFGDGTDYVLHCKGSSYDTTTGEDMRESPGECINLLVADDTVWGGEGAKWSFRNYDNSSVGFAILRPWQDPAIPETPTQEAMCRMQFPRMKITRELDRYKFDAVQNGEEVPVYLTIENKSTQEYTEVPVEEYIPQGTTLVEGSATKGAKIEGGTIKWSVKVPAGKSITLTYKVKVTGELGDTIEFKSGLVGGIASRGTSLQVGGKTLLPEQMQAIYDAGMQYKEGESSFQDLDFFNQFYKDTLGFNLGLPETTQELLNTLTKVKSGTIRRTGTDELDKMILPLHFAGQYAYATDPWEQVREYRMEYYQPGDIFVTMKGDSTTSLSSTGDLELMMYLGDDRVLVHTTNGTELKTHAESINCLMMHNLVIVLRPALGFENINATDLTNLLVSKADLTDGFSVVNTIEGLKLVGTDNYIVVTKGKKTVRIDQADWTQGDGTTYTVAYDSVAAKDMTETVKTGVYNAEGTLLAEQSVPVYDALAARLKAETDAGKTIQYEAMLHYGAAAQKYFGCNTDKLANEGLDAFDFDLTELRKDESTLEGSDKSLICGTSCVLGLSVQMKVYFKINDKEVFINGQQVELETSPTAGYYFCTLDVAAKDFFTPVTIEVRDGGTVLATATDSIASYCARLYETEAENSMELADSILLYGLAAEGAITADAAFTGPDGTREYYSSVNEAFDAWRSAGKQGTVALYEDLVVESSDQLGESGVFVLEIGSDQWLTLDLNGHSLKDAVSDSSTNVGLFKLSGNASLTIEDGTISWSGSRGLGRLSSSSEKDFSGEIKFCGTDIQMKGGASLLINYGNGGQVIFDGGSVIVSDYYAFHCGTEVYDTSATNVYLTGGVAITVRQSYAVRVGTRGKVYVDDAVVRVNHDVYAKNYHSTRPGKGIAAGTNANGSADYKYDCLVLDPGAAITVDGTKIPFTCNTLNTDNVYNVFTQTISSN